MKKLLLAAAAMLAVLLPGTPAWAHAQLLRSDPARDATLTDAPGTVTLVFSEHLNPDFATIVVSDAAKLRVAAAAPVVDAQSGTVTLSQPLGNGAYTVAYRVVSVDGHTVQGSYAFTVADPALPAAAVSAAAPSPAAAQAAAASSAGSSGIPGGVLIGLAVAGVALAATAACLYVSGRRRAATRA